MRTALAPMRCIAWMVPVRKSFSWATHVKTVSYARAVNVWKVSAVRAAAAAAVSLAPKASLAEKMALALRYPRVKTLKPAAALKLVTAAERALISPQVPRVPKTMNAAEAYYA